MDKSCHSSVSGSDSSATTSSSNSSNQYLRQLNKLSQKISKPPHNPLVKKPNFDAPPTGQTLNPPPPPPPSQPQNQAQANLQAAQQQQPPVYNINKNDFRDVVQRLTGSQAHERFSTPPPINQPKPQSSRLQRIRPPPLVQLSNRPPSLLNCAPPNVNPNPPQVNVNPAIASTAGFIQLSAAPLSPLPPFPAVHALAESPVSAYMRFLHASMAPVDPNLKPFSGFQSLAPPLSPCLNSLNAPQPPPPQQPAQGASTGSAAPQLPSSPLPFGCLNSPHSGYPLLSQSLLLSPNSGQFGIPLSPTVPVPSPTWRGL